MGRKSLKIADDKYQKECLEEEETLDALRRDDVTKNNWGGGRSPLVPNP
jgi:hypothetical protein